jgi:hypothetical protein
MTRSKLGEMKDVAKDTIQLDDDGQHAVASVPGQAGPRQPGQQTEVVDEVLDDPRVQHGKHVTVSVPRGDVEALERVRERLDVTSTRPAGSTVIVEAEASHHDDTPAVEEPSSG